MRLADGSALSAFSVDCHSFREGLPVFIVWHISGREVDGTDATDRLQTASADEADFVRAHDVEEFDFITFE